VTRPSDLPPGCSPNDIPGNRPGDDDDERFAQALAHAAVEAGITEPSWDCLDLDDPAWKPSATRWSDREVRRLLRLAEEIGYQRGFAEGRAEGEIDVAARFEPSDEEDL
jgi:hypothetical protein